MKTLEAIQKYNENKVLVDVKGIFDKKTMKDAGFLYWSL